ncbi:MAG: ISAs1 family transposase [Lentisphaeria bacterium]|nr:ISAs1 family transposase [Lentisphaeria bacterium]
MPATNVRLPKLAEEQMLSSVEVRLLGKNPEEKARYGELMERHHYLKGDTLVGEQLRYVAVADGQWVALLSWSAAAQHLRERERWIGWSYPQRRRRLALVANNARFLILPGIKCPNLASRVLALCSSRLSADWQQAYSHPILVVESFVDSQLFRGTCYKAQGWQLLGETRGFERASQDYYTEHNRPKQLWVRRLDPAALDFLSAEQLPGELQAVEDKVIPRSDATVEEIHGLWELCREVPEWRKPKGRDYPLPCLLSIMVLATLSGIVRGQRDLAAFAAKLTQPQLRALRSYQNRKGRYEYPKETTFQRVLAAVDAESFQRILRRWEDQLLGRKPLEDDDLVALDGKAQRGSTPHVDDEQKAQLVSALSLPSSRVLGTVTVEKKSNEIPAARELLAQVGPLDGKLVMLDALHTNQPTLRQIHQENGADYLLPAKGNHATLEELATGCMPPPPDPTPPATPHTPDSPDANPPRAGSSPLGPPPQANPARSPVRYRRK